MEQEMLERILTKMDAYSFFYTEDDTTLGSYIVGKTITGNKERFVSNFLLNPKDVDLFRQILSFDCSLDSRTLSIDYRLLTDEVIDILKEFYQNNSICGIHILPDDREVSRDLVSKFDTLDFDGFLVSFTSSSEEMEPHYIDLFPGEGVCSIERLSYTIQGVSTTNTNVHITRKLSSEELVKLADLLKKGNYQKLLVDFYEPTYYKEFLDVLSFEGIPQDISITFLANPLYDLADFYEGLQGIIPNSVFIQYNTCNDLNEFYRLVPHSEGVRYYSDIEASGLTDSSNYFEMIRMFEEIVEHMEREGYSPLERMAYVSDYFKKNFIYDRNYKNVQHEENANLDKVYCKDRMICEGFSNLYSALLRRAGNMCFTYGTDDHQKNIVRIKDEKYGIDNLAILDPTWDLDHDDNRNCFHEFLIPLDSDLYAYSGSGSFTTQTPSVIDIPSSLVMGSEYYYSYISESNPVYATDALGYAVRMLELMGLGSVDLLMTSIEKGEYYKSALQRSGLTERIPYSKIRDAVCYVRKREGEYSNPTDEARDYEECSDALMNRGYWHTYSPKISLFNGDEVEVSMYQSSLNVDFIPIPEQAEVLHKPRKKLEYETREEYDAYLKDYYHEMFYQRGEEEELEEYEFVENTKDDSSLNSSEKKEDLSGEQDTSNSHLVVDGAAQEMEESSLEEDGVEDASFLEDVREEDEIGDLLKEEKDTSSQTSDMKDGAFKESESNFEKASRDTVITIYRDIDDSGRTFVTKSVLERFHLPLPVFKLELTNDVDIYEINPTQAIYIIENANNKYAPYQIRYQDFDFANELRDEYSKKEKKNLSITDDEIQIYRDVEDSSRAFVTLDVIKRFHLNNLSLRVSLGEYDVYEIHPVDAINIINHASNSYAPYRIRYVNIQFEPENKTMEEHDEEEREEYIPGTSYLKPRGRKDYESDEEYVQYLEKYYESIFGKDNRLIPGTYHKKPREVNFGESWVDYEAYLESYYNKIFPQDEAKFEKNLDELLNRPIFSQRSKREDETLEEYESYLSTYYDISRRKMLEEEEEKEEKVHRRK